MTAVQGMEALQRQFGSDGAIRFERDRHGLIRGCVDHPLATGEFYLHGGHVTRWQPANYQPVLWRSESVPADDITCGGVPLCFPWFGRNERDPAVPSHGVARRLPWRLVRALASAEGVSVELRLDLKPFDVRLLVTFGHELTLQLNVRNASPESATCEAAMHAYLLVSDIGSISLFGLEDAAYLDKTDAYRRGSPAYGPLRIATEIDRIYLGTTSPCEILDPGLQRRIRIAKSGSAATVVWNPGDTRGPSMPAFSDGRWRQMVCVEPAMIRDYRVTLPPGGSHTLGMFIRVRPLEETRGDGETAA